MAYQHVVGAFLEFVVDLDVTAGDAASSQFGQQLDKL